MEKQINITEEKKSLKNQVISEKVKPVEVKQAEKVVDKVEIQATEELLVKYLEQKGYAITPSGNPIEKESLVKKAGTAVVDTVVDTGHVARGIFRSIKNKITGKVTELKEIGS